MIVNIAMSTQTMKMTRNDNTLYIFITMIHSCKEPKNTEKSPLNSHFQALKTFMITPTISQNTRKKKEKNASS